MASIAHPERPDERIDVRVIDSETHGDEYAQIEATGDGVSLSDESGGQPWVPASELDFPEQGMAETPEHAVALADGRTPEEAAEIRDKVESDD